MAVNANLDGDFVALQQAQEVRHGSLNTADGVLSVIVISSYMFANHTELELYKTTENRVFTIQDKTAM